MNPIGKILVHLHLPLPAEQEELPLVSLSELEQILQQVQEFTNSQKHKLPLLQQRLLGDLASRYLGTGMDYEESRPYQPGDELRFINWRMTARAGEFYTRLFREERKPCVYILLDRRLNMRFATRTRLKVSQAIRVAAIHAFLAHAWHIPVAGMLLDAHSQPQREMTQLKDILAWLFRAGQECPLPGNIGAEPRLTDALHLLQQRIPPGSRVVLISDFLELQETDRGILQKIRQQNDVLAIRIRDAAENRLPRAGMITLKDVHDGSMQKLDCNDPVLASHFQRAMQAEQERIEKLLQDCGIAHQTIMTSQNIEQILQPEERKA